MARARSSQPTEVELQILGVLWEAGPSTVRQVYLTLADHKDTGYSSVLKMMQVMHQKGLLLKDETVRPQLFRATTSRTETQLQMLNDMTQKVFHGSAMRLVMRMVSSGQLTTEELEEIKQLADGRQEEQK